MKALSLLTKSFRKVFGTRNDRMIKAYQRRVDQINELEPRFRQQSDSELRQMTQTLRERLSDGESPAHLISEALAVAREVMDRSIGIRNIFNSQHKFDPQQLPAEVRPHYEAVQEQIQATEPATERGCREPVPPWQQVQIPVLLYEAVRVLHPESRPPFRARPFDVQLIGGMVLSEGRIAEMKTGEGKTIVAPLACYLACLERLQCYVVTVNDYLVQRDRDWVFPFYYHLGLTVGSIHPIHVQPPEEKMAAYQCHVVYGTNSEFGFDYLRDNMQLSLEAQAQKHLDFCVIDEVDSILVDEARTPLIISGPANDDAPRYELADSVSRHLIRKQRDWDTADANAKHAQMRIKALEGDIRNARDKSRTPALREEMNELTTKLPELEVARDQHTQYYEIEMEKKAAHLTPGGIAEAQKQANVGSFYVGNNMDVPHLLENALRAHVVYQRDKDYVTREGEVIIVDEFTGRLMIGRQWSDGLHQAVEAKERVKIKQESQTLATVTIQNYFKLFRRLAGMTGTAITEATEFQEIYKLEVVCIPTNAIIIRKDREDLIYLSLKDKWDAILEEIRTNHDIGRPVLVGTTSVEHSEMLSSRLTKKFGIRHEVLNAKVDQAEREANIVDGAGQLGAVMIATNMAGRGTDIRLGSIDRSSLLAHWQQRDLLPRQAKVDMDNQQLVNLAYRHIAVRKLGMKRKDVDDLDDAEVRLRLLRHWAQTQTFIDPDRVDSMSAEQCAEVLDEASGVPLHRMDMWDHTESMGGLHIVGTERHEARRIDNQLRGRSGRQGDRGSSRFFISLEDELMQLFAKGWLMKALPKLGMKEGDSLEHRWVTRAVERAQRKVEERNFEIRKNLLEYDEVMEYQRNSFYGIRQDVLAGRGIDQVILEYIDDSVQDATQVFLDRDYVPTQIGEWCRQALEVSIEPGKLRPDNLEDLQVQIRADVRAELRQTIERELGEYMSNDLTPDQWDLRSLSSWAMSRFRVDLKHNQLRKMNVTQVTDLLIEAGEEQIDKKDLSQLAKFLDTTYAERGLCEWIEQKFAIRIEHEALVPHPSEKLDTRQERVAQVILEKARRAYQDRELIYPIDFILDMYESTAQQDDQWATEQLIGWAHQRYETDWETEDVAGLDVPDLRKKLLKAAEPWHRDGKMLDLVSRAMDEHQNEPEDLATWVQDRFRQPVESKELAGLDSQSLREVLLRKGRAMLRSELTALERFVLLQILDTSWKDHLYAMDQLRDAVSARSITDRERDPRVVYKREGAMHFEQMQKTVRDRVTELIFRARLTANVQARSVYGRQQADHADAASALSAQGSVEQQQDLETAQRAGDEPSRPMTRKSRRAARARGEPQPNSQQRRPAYKSRKRKRKSR